MVTASRKPATFNVIREQSMPALKTRLYVDAPFSVLAASTKVKIAAITLCLALVTHAVQADNYEGYKSTIGGTGIWSLGPRSNEPFISKRLSFGENPEYATYCDGNNKIYIYELDSRGFACATVSWIEFKGWKAPETYVTHSKFDGSDLEGVAALASEEAFAECEKLATEESYECVMAYDNAFQSEYIVRLGGLQLSNQGMYTVSKTRLARGNWKVKPLSESLVAELHENEAANYVCSKQLECYPIFSKQPSSEKYDGQVDRKEIEKWAISISNDEIEIVILPVAYIVGSPTDIEAVTLIVSVIARTAGSWKKIGGLAGKLIRVGADLDGDGLPEIIVDESADYSATIQYYKIYPAIDSLITYSHN